MNDQERLEELINRKPSRWGNLTIKEFERDIKILQKQAEEKRELKKELEEIKGMYVNTRKLWLEEKQQNKRYKTALEIYADETSYLTNVKGMEIDATVMLDGGEVARQALQSNREG